jgi:hypothetical protein
MRRLLITLMLFMPLACSAQESSGGGPIFMKDSLGGAEFFDTWGIGADIFLMQQDYRINDLQFVVPGAPDVDIDRISVTNDLQNYNLRFDAWLTPFLQVFALLGTIDAKTHVDLSEVSLEILGQPLPGFGVPYDGTVYGGGFNLVYGSERWFAALNNTWTKTSLNGDFDSSVSSYTAQPRIGLIHEGFMFWAGGMYLDVDESHSGSFELPIPDPANPGANLRVPFAVELQSSDKWNYAVGFGKVFSPQITMFLEVGFADRTHTLLNFTYRF